MLLLLNMPKERVGSQYVETKRVRESSEKELSKEVWYAHQEATNIEE